MHELLADHILADAGGRHQIVKLVEELDAALMVLRCPFTQLVPQDQRHTLGNTFGGQLWKRVSPAIFLWSPTMSFLYLEEVGFVSDVL